MYTRSRQTNQGFPNAGQQQRQPGTPNAQGNFQNQQGTPNSFSQQGNYQTSQSTPVSQQGNYKPANVQQFKGQPQTPNQNQARMQAQQGKPTTQQLQQQQLQQQLKQQQQQQQQAAVGTPQAQRLKPILKQSPATPAPTPTASPQLNQNQNQMNAAPTPVAAPVAAAAAANNASAENKVEGENVEGMDVQDQPRWRRKTPGLKVNRKLKRLRMNQRLRRTLQPKNAIMVLNEMKTGVQFTFPETQTSMTNSLFLVHAEIDGKTYVGQGLSKPLARQNAAENALKCLLLEKMTAASLKARIDAESDGAQPVKAENQADSSSVNDENNSEGGEKMETNTEEPDEIPWSSLASFALYKLFLEWQNQGTVVPVPRPGVSPGKVSKRETKPIVQKELPANATSVHPVMLLNQMRPGLAYAEVARVGNPPNTMFTLGVDIDGTEYTGTAKNKKDAKKITAKAALQALFGLTYPEEPKVDHAEDISMS